MKQSAHSIASVVFRKIDRASVGLAWGTSTRSIAALRGSCVLRFVSLRRVQIIALDVENSVPACAIILERDLRAQLHQLFLGKLLTQPRIQIVRNIRWRIGHPVRQLNDKTFRIVKRRPVVAKHSVQLVIVQPCFSAHGRIDIYSERTTNPGCSADFSKLNVTQ